MPSKRNSVAQLGCREENQAKVSGNQTIRAGSGPVGRRADDKPLDDCPLRQQSSMVSEGKSPSDSTRACGSGGVVTSKAGRESQARLQPDLAERCSRRGSADQEPAISVAPVHADYAATQKQLEARRGEGSSTGVEVNHDVLHRAWDLKRELDGVQLE